MIWGGFLLGRRSMGLDAVPLAMVASRTCEYDLDEGVKYCRERADWGIVNANILDNKTRYDVIDSNKVPHSQSFRRSARGDGPAIYTDPISGLLDFSLS